MKTRSLLNRFAGSGDGEAHTAAVKPVHYQSANPRLRSSLFACGDALFLLLVSISSTAVMHIFHLLEWPLALSLACGMVAAMGVQVLLANGVAPLLGSIESMVPSMVVAMASPMTVCALALGGAHVDLWKAVGLGAAIGILVFVLIQAYGSWCRRSLHRTIPRGWGL